MIIITAPSGAGKTTICRYLIDQIERLNFSISATNRTPRSYEKDGVDYYFYSTDEFKHKVEKGFFLEWEEVYPGRYYGTPYSEIRRIRKEGIIPIFDVDVKGAISLKEKFKKEALSIFLKPPSIEELKNRLYKRNTESEESIQSRLKRAQFEIEQAHLFDLIIVNDDLKEAKLQTLYAVKAFLNQPQLIDNE